MVVKRLIVSPASIGLIKQVRSVFALSPYSKESREIILVAAGRLFMSDAKIESVTNLVSVIVPKVLRFITKTEGCIEVTKS